MTKVKELLNVPGYENKKIVIRKPGYGIKCDIQDKAMEINVDPRNPAQGLNVGLSVGKLRLYTLAMCITEAPFFEENGKQMQDIERRCKIIHDLDSETGDYIYAEIESMQMNNIISEEVEKK